MSANTVRFMMTCLFLSFVAVVVAMFYGFGLDNIVSASSNCYDLLNAAGQVVDTVCH